MHGKEKDSIRKKQSRTARVPPICNPPNAREVGPVAEEIIERMVWKSSFGRFPTKKASLQKRVINWWESFDAC